MENIIECLGAALLFYNKILLYKDKRFAWLLGIVAILIISIPTYDKELLINFSYHGGLIALMAYGYATWSDPLNKKVASPKVFIARLFVIFSTFCLCIFMFFKLPDGGLNAWQLGQSITGLLGALFLALSAKLSHVGGWIFNILSHVACIYCSIHVDLYWIAFFQILSIPVALLSIKKELQRKPFYSG